MELFHHSFDRIFFLLDGKEKMKAGDNLLSSKESIEKTRQLLWKDSIKRLMEVVLTIGLRNWVITLFPW